MKYLNGLVAIAVLFGVAACGGNETRSCDEVRRYELAEEGKRVETPEGLDSLNPLNEIPLPEANPRPPRPEGSPCIDLPPSVLGAT